MRVGILGGTFDPPHIGHLEIAEEARSKLSLDRVYFIPAREPPHKLNQPVTPVQDRVEMVQLALAGSPYFSLSLVEVERAGPSFTVDTVRELKRDFPPGTEIYFIMGTDSLVQLRTWHHPEELIRLCWLAVLQRPGYEADMKALEKQIPGVTSRAVFIPAPAIEISSTELQARCRAGQSLEYLVPDSVAEYIREHRLYSGEEKEECS